MIWGIILSLALLTYIAYKGYSVILFAPVCALVAAYTADFHPLTSYTELFMPNAVGYVRNFFPVFLLGAVFGKVMEDSGAARSVAKAIAESLGPQRAILAVVLAAAVLTYGGVSLFVVAFAVYPFSAALFEAGGLPRRLIPGSIALGAFTFTMTAIPGTPQIQNIIPTRYFQTDAFAAPLFGSVGAILMLSLGLCWLEYRKRRMLAAGETFGEKDTRMQTTSDGIPDIPAALAALPLLTVLVLNYILTKFIPSWDISILNNPVTNKPIGATAFPTANWALIISLIVGIVLAVILSGKQFKARNNLQAALNGGAIGSLLAIMNTASEVGYGNVIRSLPGFETVKAGLTSIAPSMPLISETLAVNLLAGITGSASGGMSIALEAMGAHYLEMALKVGLNPELLHRVASMSSGGFDTMPHNGAVITLLAICGMNHKKSYPDIGMTSLVIPFAICFSLILIWTVLGLQY